MITGSILLVLVAAALLVLGLVRGSDVLYYSSIATSAVAALALIVGVRQLPEARLPDEDFDLSGATPGAPGGQPFAGTLSPRPIGRAPVPRQPVSGGPATDSGSAEGDAAGPATTADAESAEPDDVPPDEPPAQPLTPDEAARLAGLGAGVVVINGRPRYHVAGCLHLLGRETYPLPVSEAVELGFSPCAECAPATALLADGPQA